MHMQYKGTKEVFYQSCYPSFDFNGMSVISQMNGPRLMGIGIALVGKGTRHIAHHALRTPHNARFVDCKMCRHPAQLHIYTLWTAHSAHHTAQQLFTQHTVHTAHSAHCAHRTL